MTSKHTPGPWKVGISVDHGIHCVDAQSDSHPVIEVCEVWGTECDIEETSESRANAHLIATAPELLEALTNLVNCFSLHRADPGVWTVLDNPVRAIEYARTVLTKVAQS